VVGVVLEHLGVAAVGAADQQHDVGPALAQGVERGVREAVVTDVHDLAAARQRDPPTRLGGHQLLVADDRDPQATARRRARQHLRTGRAGVDAAQLGQAGVPAVEDVGVDRGRVVGGGEQLTGAGVDQRGLGERGPEVHAGDQLAHARGTAG